MRSDPSSRPSGELTPDNCDREPVHLPGWIQPHGVLLVLRATDLVIVQISANCFDWLGNTPEAGASSETPVAAFGKFFMTQPYSALNDGNLYGEITGLVSSADNVKIFNLVQLYR